MMGYLGEERLKSNISRPVNLPKNTSFRMHTIYAHAQCTFNTVVVLLQVDNII